MLALPQRLRPIAILAFNRPDYLRQVVESLLAQQDARLDEREIVLFQDGGRNPISGVEYASEADIDASVRVFAAAFPAKRIERSPVNLGVALNFERAENYVFETLNADAAIFLEDDLVMDARYLSVLDQLIELAIADERIGYVAAYGYHLLSLAQQRQRPAYYVILEQFWAFGLTRRQWLRNKPYVDEYLAIVRGVDYRQRPQKEIHRLYHSWGMGCPGSSQDVTKAMACGLTGALRINTSMCLGRYIGERGLHFNPDAFAKRRYAATEIYPDALPALPVVTSEDYDRIFAVQHRWAVAFPCDVA